MKRVLSVSCLLLILAALASCRSSSKHGPEGAQEQFGVHMAKMNLWREALFRFKRAVEISPADAQAHNNLAVAYEANGDFESAAKEYREAMRLDKTNQYIQKNYSRLIEFQSRNKKRQRPQTAATRSSGHARRRHGARRARELIPR
jgi:Flp pilus assembly protein TadD